MVIFCFPGSLLYPCYQTSVCFSPVNLSHVHLITSAMKNNLEGQRKTSSPDTCNKIMLWERSQTQSIYLRWLHLYEISKLYRHSVDLCLHGTRSGSVVKVECHSDCTTTKFTRNHWTIHLQHESMVCKFYFKLKSKFI